MIRQLWTVGLSVLACCLVLCAAWFFNPIEAQPPAGNKPLPPPPPGANWRYQIITWGTNHNSLILLDTQTGRAWEKSVGGRWMDSETPPSQEKK